LQAGDDLDGARAVADDADALVAEVVAGRGSVAGLLSNVWSDSPGVPVTRVHHLALEGIEARDGGPGDLVELAPGRDEDVGRVVQGLARGEVGDFDLPVASVNDLDSTGCWLFIHRTHHFFSTSSHSQCSTR